MKTSFFTFVHHLRWQVILAFAFGLLAVPAARAGLGLTMNVVQYYPGYYYINPNLSTNATPPDISFGTYLLVSPEYPTNGLSVLYRFDVNGFNQIDGSPYAFFNDFASLTRGLTNGNWSILATNSVMTNVYTFAYTVNLVSNDLPPVTITFPADGAVNVTNLPTFAWQGPANFSELVVYGYNFGLGLPTSQTSLPSPSELYLGRNSFTVHYYSNSVTALVASVPRDLALQPLSSWEASTHLDTYRTANFTVGTADTSGTSHTLVAHYPWDGTNLDGSAVGADSSGNGHDLNFGGGYGSQGGVNSTADPAAGPRAIQFHDGDDNSAGFVGWSPTPPALLDALAASFSISCWIKTTQSKAWDDAPAEYGAGIVSADVGGVANDVIPLALTGSKIGFNTGGDSEDVTMNSSAEVNDGNYHHIVVTRNRQTGQKIIYIDGVLDSFGGGSTNLLNDPKLLTIGALSDAYDSNPANVSYYNGFDGELDDLQIYSGVLSAGEVAGLFANPGTTAANGGGFSGGHTNLAYYKFENGSIFSSDASGNGNNISSAGSFGGGTANAVSDSFAGGNYAGLFNGNDSASGFSINPPASLLAALARSFTVSLWIKTTQVSGNDSDGGLNNVGLVAAFNGGAKWIVPMALTGSKLAFATGGSPNDTLHSAASINTGDYVHLVVTRDQASGAKKIYVNGVLDAADTGTTDVLDDPNQLNIGASNGHGYNGRMDEIQIYSGVLEATEVTYLYNHPGSTVADTAAGGGTLADALDTTNLAWTTGGDANWFPQSVVTHDGVDAARSGPLPLGNYDYSYIQTTVTGPGTLTFWWQNVVNDDSLYTDFYIDGNYQNEIYGQNGWQQDGPYVIGPGTHTLYWETDDDGTSDPNAAGLLDQVSFVPDAPSTNSAPVITVNPFSQTNSPGYTVGLYAAATSNPTATWQWFKVGSGLITNATSALYLPTNSGTVGVAGSYYAVASNLLGSATTLTATVTFASAPLPPDWSLAFRPQLYNDFSHITTNYNIACLLDATGTNIYTVGSIQGTNTFGPDTLILGIGHSGSMFLKQTTTGTPIWGRAMTNNGNGSSYAQCVVPAPGNGTYVSGVIFGTNWLGTNQLVDVAGGSTYLARFDENGSNLWVHLITGTNFNFTTYHMLASDPDGNVTLSALIWGDTSFGTTNVFADGQKGVLAQYDANGNIRWLQMPSSWPDYLTYGDGRLYGSMGNGSPSYIGGVTNVSDRRRVLFALNATNGQGVWMQGVAAQQNQGPPVFGNDDVLVAVAGTNVFIAGNAWGSNAVFGPFTVNFPNSEGQYFARYDTAGNAQLATAFGSPYTWLWTIKANAAGNAVYIGGDFDTYSVFGNNVIAAPFYDTIQSVDGIENRIPGQTFVAKFDREGNPLWARPAQSSSSYVNSRDIALAPDGVWSCGFFNPTATFGTNTVYGGITVSGFPFGTIEYHSSGYLAKITDGVATALPVTLLNPANNGANFQFQFLSQSGFTHSILYRTNLSIGNWKTNSTVTGNGTLTNISLPLSLFSPANQGYLRVTTQ